VFLVAALTNMKNVNHEQIEMKWTNKYFRFTNGF